MFLVNAVLLSIVVLVSAVEYYKTEFDDKDPNVFYTDEVMRRCIDCYLEKAPCSGFLLNIKPVIHESFITACAKCTEKQKLLGKVFMEKFRSKYPEEYEIFWNKYDPEDKYKSKILAVFNAAVADA